MVEDKLIDFNNKMDDNFSSSSSSSQSNNGFVTIRKLLINSAINFLNNPRLKSTSNDEKRKFLSGKGLTSDEIDLAFDLAISRPLNEANLKKELDLLASRDISTFNGFINKFYQIIIWSGFIYGAYSLYQEKIRPYLFDDEKNQPPEKLICQEINRLSNQINELSRNIAIVHEFISTYCQLRDDSLGKMKKELSSIKSLLVNPNQFPAVPSIPKWQLTKKEPILNNTSDNDKESI